MRVEIEDLLINKEVSDFYKNLLEKKVITEEEYEKAIECLYEKVDYLEL